MLHVKICPLGGAWEISGLHYLFWDLLHVSETNRAVEILLHAGRYVQVLGLHVKICPLWDIWGPASSPHFLLCDPLDIFDINRARKLIW